ncbi:MAG: ISAs1 family transposase [Deltaproteobacteria bacterium]|nr:ISAs1 family transposase [Deltaproteobacteria bacterium]
MAEIDPTTILDEFKAVPDPRIISRTRHKLIDIITITICATICGADDWIEIVDYGLSKYEWLTSFLDLPNGIPSHDTFSRVFSILSPEAFNRCFSNWINTVFGQPESDVLPIDGKTLRRSHDRSSGKSAIHIVSAWSTKLGISIGQVKTDAKSNEIKAIPELLDILEPKGCIVTIDAMGCQTKIAKQIIDKGGDYLLALKGNQGTLHDDVELFFSDAERTSFKDIPFCYHETTDGDHGRIEVRKYTTVSDIDWLNGKDKWASLKTIGMVESERHIGDKITAEKRYYISSIDNDAQMFAKAVRSHWGIENSLHWVLDVTFREDESRIRKGNSAENMAVIRHMALNLLKQEKTAKASMKVKRKRCGWDNDYLLKILRT